MSPPRRKGTRLGSISTRSTAPVLTAVVVAAAAVWFLVSTVLTGFTSDAAIVGCAGALACAFAFASGLPALQALQRDAPGALRQAAFAGVLMLAVAPALVLANRYSDAPPGTEVLFFTTASWALLAVVVAASFSRAASDSVRWPSVVTYGCMALVGSALILANWERPSSFSPFMRYWREELYLLAAGLAWAVGSVAYVRAREALGQHDARAVALLAGGLSAVAYWLVSVLTGSGSVGDWGTLVVGGLAYVALVHAWFALTDGAGALRAPFALFLVPVLMTALGVIEQRVNPRGPDPVIWTGALSGVALVLLASTAAASWRPVADRNATATRALRLQTRMPHFTRLAVLLSVAASAAAVVSLALPAINANVLGRLSLGKPYAARWVMLGYETAGGWLPAVAGLLVLAAAWALHSRAHSRDVVVPAGLSLVVLGLYPTSASTPFHTWNTWLPSSLQVEFGTEYVALTFSVIHHPARLAIMGLTALAAVFLLCVAVSSQRTSTIGTASEVSR